MKKENVLFICRFNRNRSRVAEAYFNKIKEDKNLEAKSAGLFKGSPVGKEDIRLAKKFGIDIRGRIQGISSKLLAWQTLTIIVADDVPPEIFNKNRKVGMKIRIWKIKDSQYQKNPERLIKEIIKKVDNLVKGLKLPKRFFK